ncbi:MAG: MBL fold metallo-hydrolase [Anaerolineae bacterium]|nr:MBL fold metallo-hydrolase [Anaerolineae bacterium]NIN95420.1 MBL fold metallo-hydrolase [Anaerolineae bacterium]
MGNFCYIIGDRSNGEAAVVDPHGEIDRVLQQVESLGLSVKYIVNTHTHWDHVAGNEELKERTGASVLTHSEGRIPRDAAVCDGDTISLGELEITVLHTPGHSLDSICLLVDKRVMTGDTLFVGECGRTDLPGGDAASMYHSLFHVLSKLDDDTKVYPGHDYGDRPSSTIGYEKTHNYTLEPRTKEEFVRFMAQP